MNKMLYKIFLAIILIFIFNSAHAELFINPVANNKTGAGEGSVHFGSSSVEYEVGGASFDIERTFFGASYAHGLSNTLDVFGTFSLTLESEIENSTSDGDGIILGGGVRASVPNNMGVAIDGYAQFLIIDEDYGSSLDGEEMSIMFGAVASKALDNSIKIYGGLEFNLYSDMEINNADVDRDDVFGFRVGANFKLGDIQMNVNTALKHETGIFLSASKPL